MTLTSVLLKNTIRTEIIQYMLDEKICFSTKSVCFLAISSYFSWKCKSTIGVRLFWIRAIILALVVVTKNKYRYSTQNVVNLRPQCGQFKYRPTGIQYCRYINLHIQVEV